VTVEPVDTLTGSDASAAVFEPWTEEEQGTYIALVDVLDQSRGPVRMPRESFDRLLDMMSRFPATAPNRFGDSECHIINLMITDPEDPKLHLVIRGRKVYAL
jgi:hypothetical protein